MPNFTLANILGEILSSFIHFKQIFSQWRLLIFSRIVATILGKSSISKTGNESSKKKEERVSCFKKSPYEELYVFWGARQW